MIVIRNHWRLGIIDKAREFLQGNMCIYILVEIDWVLMSNDCFSIFHILDSISQSSPGTREANQLEIIFLKHFDHVIFKGGRIATNFAQVIVIFFIMQHKSSSNQ